MRYKDFSLPFVHYPENFFGLMKNELLYVNRFDSMDDFKRQLADYIDYYNNKRIKLKLKMSPVQY